MYTTTASTGMANNCSGPVSGNTATDDEEDEEDSLGRVVVSVLEEPAVTSLSLLLLASSFVELGNLSYFARLYLTHQVILMAHLGLRPD